MIFVNNRKFIISPDNVLYVSGPIEEGALTLENLVTRVCQVLKLVCSRLICLKFLICRIAIFVGVLAFVQGLGVQKLYDARF